MSLHDPNARRQQSAGPGRISKPGAALLLAIVTPIAIIAAALVGFSFVGIGVTGPIPEGAEGLAVAGACMIPVVVISGICFVGALTRFAGIRPSLLWFLALGCCGVVLGAVFGAAWTGGSGMADAVVPLAVAAVALFFAGLVVFVLERLRRRRIAAVARSGAVATGTVTAVEVVGSRRQFGENGPVVEIWIRATVKFTDQSGRERWARKFGYLRPEAAPQAGDRVQVHYDGRRPSQVGLMTFDLPWTAGPSVQRGPLTVEDAVRSSMGDAS